MFLWYYRTNTLLPFSWRKIMPDFKSMDKIIADCAKENPPYVPQSFGKTVLKAAGAGLAVGGSAGIFTTLATGGNVLAGALVEGVEAVVSAAVVASLAAMAYPEDVRQGKALAETKENACVAKGVREAPKPGF
jgi:hypothetical protein